MLQEARCRQVKSIRLCLTLGRDLSLPWAKPKHTRLAYEGSFAGMTREAVSLDALLKTREKLFRELPASLDANERDSL